MTEIKDLSAERESRYKNYLLDAQIGQLILPALSWRHHATLHLPTAQHPLWLETHVFLAASTRMEIEQKMTQVFVSAKSRTLGIFNRTRIKIKLIYANAYPTDPRVIGIIDPAAVYETEYLQRMLLNGQDINNEIAYLTVGKSPEGESNVSAY